MSYKINLAKRILLMFLVGWITFTSVWGAYQKTVEAAEWIAGTIAAVGAAPICTALLIGGVVVAGGVALYELSQTSAEDHRAFVDGIKSGFQDFVADREKQIALEQDSSLTDQQAADRGVAVARDTINNFASNALNVTKTTAKNLKTKTVEYWNSFCKVVSQCADTDNDTPVINGYRASVTNLSGENITSIPLENSSDNLISYNDRLYVQKGIYTAWGDANMSFDVSSLDTNDRINFCYEYMIIAGTGFIYFGVNRVNVNKLTGQVMAIVNIFNGGGMGNANTANSIIGTVKLPVIVTNDGDGSAYVSSNLQSISLNGQIAETPTWKRTINNTLEDTHMGKAIKTGRRAKIQAGNYVGSMFGENSIPVKKSAVKVGDTTAVGTVGWDIPVPDVWDDVFSGGLPYSDVVGGTGVIGVPADDVISRPTDTTIEVPKDVVVQDTEDFPKDDPDEWEELPEIPLPEIIEEQEGDFFPTEMELSSLFPFCIPFDIIYLIDKFDVSGGRAPVITLPIVYPNAIRGIMGTDRYTITINMQDYVIVRDVIRIFLLLLFLIGLMQITRNLIRG